MQMLSTFLVMIFQLLLSIALITLALPLILPIALFSIVGQLFAGLVFVFKFLIDACVMPLNDYSKLISQANEEVLKNTNIPEDYSFNQVSEDSFYKSKSFYQFIIGYLIAISSFIFIISIITSGFWFI